MMTKIKQRVIVILLVIAITASAIITIGLNPTTSARADSGYVDVPQITVATQFYGHSLDKGMSGREKAYGSATHTHIVIF